MQGKNELGSAAVFQLGDGYAPLGLQLLQNRLQSFFGHMKDEIDYKSCRTIEELKILIDDYMDYYNNDRCQWNLKKLTPVQ